MKSACEDLFFARARAVKEYAAKHTVASSGSSFMPVDTAKSIDEKTRVLDDLMDVKIMIPSSEYFASDVSYLSIMIIWRDDAMVWVTAD